ncbi:hypothetical protein HAX54_038891, partial [Datura stramonium]|nr:hypothetical protein [Datura stramonium]
SVRIRRLGGGRRCSAVVGLREEKVRLLELIKVLRWFIEVVGWHQWGSAGEREKEDKRSGGFRGGCGGFFDSGSGVNGGYGVGRRAVGVASPENGARKEKKWERVWRW